MSHGYPDGCTQADHDRAFDDSTPPVDEDRAYDEARDAGEILPLAHDPEPRASPARVPWHYEIGQTRRRMLWKEKYGDRGY